MLYLFDLISNTCTPFESEEELAFWWKRHFADEKFRFNELNVTGKDTICAPAFWKWVDGLGYVAFHPEFHLRRYHIKDEHGRSIDPRLWSDSIWNAYSPYRSNYCFPFLGYKDHCHRIQGPAMAHRSMRLATDRLDIDELIDENLPVPTRSVIHISVVSPINNDFWDDGFYNHKFHSKTHEKSWKKQSHARKQWARHKDGVTRQSIMTSRGHTYDIDEKLEYDDEDLGSEAEVSCFQIKLSLTPEF